MAIADETFRQTHHPVTIARNKILNEGTRKKFDDLVESMADLARDSDVDQDIINSARPHMAALALVHAGNKARAFEVQAAALRDVLVEGGLAIDEARELAQNIRHTYWKLASKGNGSPRR